MKPSVGVLALLVGFVLLLGFAAPAVAQEQPAPPRDEPAKEQPAQPPTEEAAKPPAEAPANPTAEEPAKPAAEAPAKEETAKPAAEAPAKPAAETAPKAEAPKELTGCAKSLLPLAESYKSAYDDLQKLIAAIDSQTAAANEKVKKLQDQIQQNETAITKAKLDGEDDKAKKLTKENKQLWKDLDAAKKSQSSVCKGFAKDVEQRVKKYAAESEKKYDEYEKGLK